MTAETGDNLEVWLRRYLSRDEPHEHVAHELLDAVRSGDMPFDLLAAIIGSDWYPHVWMDRWIHEPADWLLEMIRESPAIRADLAESPEDWGLVSAEPGSWYLPDMEAT